MSSKIDELRGIPEARLYGVVFNKEVFNLPLQQMLIWQGLRSSLFDKRNRLIQRLMVM